MREKILLFAKAGIAAKCMRGNSYLQIGSMCMGIAGSILNQDLLQEYFGMRSESVDETEILRRMDKGIYDHEEFEKALAWTRAHCQEGFDKNPADMQFSREEKDAQWEFVVKNMLIVRDLMIGNPRLAEMGFIEESCGHNAIVGGHPGPAPVDGLQAQLRFPGGHAQQPVRLERLPGSLCAGHGKRYPQRHDHAL